MATTLHDMMIAVSRVVQETREGTASAAGSTTTLVDSSLNNTPDDFWNGGTVFLRSGTNINLSRTVTDFVSSTGTVSFAGVVASTAKDDKYAIASKRFSKAMLISAINTALATISLPLVNETLTGTGDLEYNIPSGVGMIVRVENAASGSDYALNYWWVEINGVLQFDADHAPADGDSIRLTYISTHTRVDADTDVINPLVHPERLTWQAAVAALRARMQIAKLDDPQLLEMLKEAQQREQMVIARYPVRIPFKTVHLSRF